MSVCVPARIEPSPRYGAEVGRRGGGEGGTIKGESSVIVAESGGIMVLVEVGEAA